MWNRKRKVYKYYISKMVWTGREKNLDFRAGPDILDVYERKDSECSKEVYEQYPHEKVSCTRACYFRKEDTYTYCKYEGEEIISPKESYDMVQKLLLLPIEKVKTTSKSNIEWAIKALDILIEEKNENIHYWKNQVGIYTKEYIDLNVEKFFQEIEEMKSDKDCLIKILEYLCFRKTMKLEKKQEKEQKIFKTLKNEIVYCSCGAKLNYEYNKCFCGSCGCETKNIWSKLIKKITKKEEVA